MDTDTIFATGLPDGLDEATLRDLFEPHGVVKWCKLLKPGNGKHAALVQFETAADATSIVDNFNGTSLSEGMPPFTLRFKDPKASSAAKGGGKWHDRSGPYSPIQSQSIVPLIAPAGFLGQGSKGGKSAGKGNGKGKGDSSIIELKKALVDSGKLPCGKWKNGQNDDPALFISSLPKDTTEWDLYEILAAFGAIPVKGLRLMKSKATGNFNGAAIVSFVDPVAAHEAITALDGTTYGNGFTLKVSMKTGNSSEAT